MFYLLTFFYFSASLWLALNTIEVIVQRHDAFDFTFDLGSLICNFFLFDVHAGIHFLELPLLHVEILVLCLHDCLVLVQEGAHVLQLIVPEDLELLKVGRDFIWRWDSAHLVDAGLQQLVLALDDAFEVSEQLLHLGH